MKKKVALMMAAAMVLSSGAMYSNLAVQAESVNHVVISTEVDSSSYYINVEGAIIPTAAYAQGEHIMVPLRETAEALGYEVKWNPENRLVELQLPQSPIWTIVQPNLDQYAYNRMYKSLGVAPVNNEGKIFVPSSFFSEILRGQVTVEGRNVTITSQSQQEDVKYMQAHGVITAIHNEEQHKSLQINGVNTDGTILNIDEETKILNSAGEQITLDNLSIGLSILVKHSLAMTMSLPGQTYAYEIAVADTEIEADLLGTAGTIEQMNNESDQLSILVNGDAMSSGSQEKIVLQISEETVIVDLEGNPVASEQLTKDAKVLTYYGPMLSKSLPPIGKAWKIVYLGNE